MKIFYKDAYNYALGGALFGCLFPIIGTLIRINLADQAVDIQQILAVQQQDPLLWIINTAPFFLGLFAFFIGRQIDRLLEGFGAALAETEAWVAEQGLAAVA